jgi:acylphosphatase
MGEDVKAEILVIGRVQGVGYRYFACDRARDLGLNGYAMNLPEGDKVKLEVEGKKETIEEFLKDLKKGPSGAYVKEVKIEWSENLNEFRGFDIRF